MQFVPNSLRMVLATALILLLVQLPRMLVCALMIQSNVCGTCDISYSSDFGSELLYVNGKLVGRDVFCEVLKFLYHKDHCFIPTVIRNHICGSDDSSMDEFHPEIENNFVHPVVGRKYLHPVVREKSIGEMSKAKRDQDNTEESFLNSKMLAMGVPGFCILCSCLLCPCIRARKKATACAIVSKTPNSMEDSVSSREMNSVSERVSTSPRRPPSPSRFSMSPLPDRVGPLHLNMNQIRRATNNFSPSLMIGEGGYGTIYKGRLEDGRVVAIKRANKEHFEALRTDFSSEVDLLAKIDHRSLVKLLGYVDKGNERLIITEYVSNGTLREHLDGERGKILDFSQRLEILIDVSHALTYLHSYAEKQIIHRDVKSSNILLTPSMRAKVADFGFARLGDIDGDKTHISTKVKGTVGYLDPEYMKTFKLTPKSDVYSFGVLLLEILTGRRPVEMNRPPEERITLRWAFRNYKNRNLAQIIDPLMTDRVDDEILMKMLGLAIQCAAPTRTDRPEMKVVGEQLWTIRMDFLRSVRSQ